MTTKTKAVDVLEYMKTSGLDVFTTLGIAQKFRVRPTQAAALIAILRLMDKLSPGEEAPSGAKDPSKRWRLIPEG